MPEEYFEEMEIPNPDAHYILQPKTIKVLVVKISEREIVEKVDLTLDGDRFSHKFLKDGEGWKPCLHCGDLIGVPLGGPLPTVDAVRASCSMYGKY